MATRKQGKIYASPEVEIAALKRDLADAQRRLDSALEVKQALAAELERAQLTIEALQHMLVKERNANDIPF